MRNDFKTLLLLKCVTSRKFAVDFLERGILKFGKPQEWIDAWEKEGSGRGDLLEGSFASITKKDYRKSVFYKSARSNSIEMIDPRNSHIHFQSKDVLNLPTCCFFGLNDYMFNNMRKAEDGSKYPSGKINKNYFKDFANNLDKETYENCEEDDRPALIMIRNPQEFRKRFEKYFLQNGVELSEVLYAPITYLDKSKEFLLECPSPYELFTKDDRFSNQSEIRIILNTKNKKFLKKLEKNNGIVELGNMSDIANVEGYYFNDFMMQRRENKFIYTLATPKVTPIPQETLDYIESIKDSGMITAHQIVNGKECPLVVERDPNTGRVLRMYPDLR